MHKHLAIAALVASALVTSPVTAQTVYYAYDAPGAGGTYAAHGSSAFFRKAWHWSRRNVLPVLREYVNLPPIVDDLLNTGGGAGGGATPPPAETPVVFAKSDDDYRKEESQYCEAARLTLQRLVKLRESFPGHVFNAPTDCKCEPAPVTPAPGGQDELPTPPGVKFDAQAADKKAALLSPAHARAAAAAPVGPYAESKTTPPIAAAASPATSLLPAVSPNDPAARKAERLRVRTRVLNELLKEAQAAEKAEPPPPQVPPT